jgi:glycosyltransferase involved in cell wall biosynthesis
MKQDKVNGVEASVVIPTRDRPHLLAKCLDALSRQETGRRFEVLVVDDGSEPPIADIDRAGVPVRILRSEGIGPARARNMGVAAATGELVLFTDDDTTPEPMWLESASSFLDAHADCVGVEGPVLSRPYDRLYELSIENVSPGAYWTSNVAYRREVLERIEGLDEGYPYPHCEDRDLGLRALQQGRIGFADGMRVWHEPRRYSIRDAILRARFASSEIVLIRRFPECFGVEGRVATTFKPVENGLRYWYAIYERERSSMRRSPARFARWAACTTGYALVALLSVVAFGFRSGRSTTGARGVSAPKHQE